MGRIFFICFAAIMLSGCVTDALIRASKAHDVLPKAHDVLPDDVPPEIPALRLLSASIVEEGNGADRQLHLYLCFSRVRLGQPEELVLARIPTSYPFAINGYPVLPASDLFKGCDEPTGMRSVRQLPIIEKSVSEPVTLPEGAIDAVIVTPLGQRTDFDYGSATPVPGSYRRVTIDPSYLYFYFAPRDEYRVEHHEARPYLLLLTPVTVVIDGAAIVAYFALWACANGGCQALAHVKYK